VVDFLSGPGYFGMKQTVVEGFQYLGRFPDSYLEPEDFLEISLNNNTLYCSFIKLPVFFLRVPVNPSPTKFPTFCRYRVTPSRQLLKLGYIHLLATDAHDPQNRPPLLSQAVTELSRLVGEPRARAMVTGIPEKINKGEPGF
jgi:hypothetical protein